MFHISGPILSDRKATLETFKEHILATLNVYESGNELYIKKINKAQKKKQILHKKKRTNTNSIKRPSKSDEN